jgi:hypothetical protein
LSQLSLSHERIRSLLESSEKACFTLQALLTPVPVTLRATLNGESLD